jgi:hypothetical protein
MVLTRNPEAVRALVTALIAEVMKNQPARTAFVQALRANREPIAQIAAENPEVLTALIKALAAVAADRGKQELESLVD